MKTISGTIERITYYNSENGYTVLRLQADSNQEIILKPSKVITVVGNLPELSPGEHVKIEGEWVTHPKHGEQFSATSCQQIPPVTVDGIRKYLGSGLIKGIGPKLAERIVQCFGEQTLTIIEHDPDRLSEVPDIGPKRIKIIITAWEEQKHVKDIMLFLHAHAISTNLAVKIYKTYGDGAIRIVKSDPYRLARDIYGVGFKTADRIAQNLGLPKEHPSRLEAGVIYILNEGGNNGHVFIPQKEVVRRVADLLGLDQKLVTPAVARLRDQGLIRVDDVPLHKINTANDRVTNDQKGQTDKQSVVYPMPYYHAEVGVAEALSMLLSFSKPCLRGVQPILLHETNLSDEQEQAILATLMNPISILTGGPGTGKTTTIRVLIETVEASKKKYALASPTGRAAKRLSEAAGRPASTIHRLLGYKPGEGFNHHRGNPLQVDLLVIDEVSMLDLLLANNLLKAVSPGTHILFVGDVDQLPPVGAGDVLRDMIASGKIPVTRLSKIYRQDVGSQIIINAHRINQGEMPKFPRSRDSQTQKQPDFFLFQADDAETAADWIIDVVAERVPHTFGFDPIKEIQVLAPMYRGAVGVNTLNQRLQAVLNPPKERKQEKLLGGTLFRVGDKVMQIQNDYDKDVYNGDIGFISRISLIDHTLAVLFEGRHVVYDWSECDKLVHAYAVSVHKSQGSEFPVVVMPIVTQHYLMLQRNLLYTAITRAKKLCVLVGSKKAIGIAIRNNRVTQRYTALDWRIRIAPQP
ncbi:MAG: ATP-dependent RecD-like DNA helicase [Anaerolineales bacterium]|nr:ATP-dependent RecD-like DNA helicase [Anaerolineales bacterium]